MSKDIKIYTEYEYGGKSVAYLTKKYHIARSTLYNIIDRVEKGEPERVEACARKCVQNARWQYLYQARYLSIPKNRKKETVEKLKTLIREMHADHFVASEIAKLTKKDRSTINFHLNSNANDTKTVCKK
jgi:DNA invertase Pin-like site-specific DNA recombinase